MIIYLHGFDASCVRNHEKLMQLQMIDNDVRLISYSTHFPKHDFNHLLHEVIKQVGYSDDPLPLLVGLGLGGYWAERIGFLLGLPVVMVNPNLFPQHNMQGLIDRPEEYEDIAAKCVSDFRIQNRGRALVLLSRVDEELDSVATARQLASYYQIHWDETQPHGFTELSPHLNDILQFKQGQQAVNRPTLLTANQPVVPDSALSQLKYGEG